MTQTIMNVGQLPQGRQRYRMIADSKLVEICIDWSHVRLLALNASRNKSGKSQAGPVAARLVKS